MAERLTDPERELALSYAPSVNRPVLRLLWLLDERFGAIVGGTGEPAIGEMRLLWWRESLEKLDAQRPAEPLLAAIGEALAGRPGTADEWGAMAEGWHALLQDPLDRGDLDRFARERGERLFRLSARLLERDAGAAVEAAGRGWALADLACRCSDEPLAEAARELARDALAEAGPDRWPRPLRPLGALAVLARRDAAAGASPRRQGAPGRVARMAWHRLTGR